jgi:hypothetical protein
MKQVPKPTTAYLDDSEPLLKIPIWRGCAAAHESVNSTWLPAVKEPAKSKEKEKEGGLSDEGEDDGYSLGGCCCSCCSETGEGKEQAEEEEEDHGGEEGAFGREEDRGGVERWLLPQHIAVMPGTSSCKVEIID